MAFPEAQQLLQDAQPDLESPALSAESSPRPSAYSDAIKQLERLKQSPEQLKVCLAAAPPPPPPLSPRDRSPLLHLISTLIPPCITFNV